MVWVIGAVVFEEEEGDFDEFVEDGDEDGHFGFAGRGEAVGESFEARVVAACGESGHEEDAAEVAIAFGADGSSGTQAGAGLTNAWRDAEPGGGGASVGEMAWDFGEEPGGGPLADSFDLAEMGEIFAQFRGRAEVGVDLGLEAGHFLFQSADDAGEAFADKGIGGAFGPVAFGLEHGGEVGAAAHQGAQGLLGGAGRLPGGQLPGAAKAGDERGIETVGLVTASEAAGVILDAAGIGQMHVVTGGMELMGGQFAVVTGGLQDGQRGGGAVLAAPPAQGLETR